jgi:cell division protein FtsQ
VSTRAVDPRIRERWVAVRRAEGRRRLRILLVLLAVALVGTAAWVALASPLLDVDHIIVRGTVHTTPEQVASAAQIARGDAMIWVDDGAAASRVEALPWVRSAHVVRDWPGTVRITVTERTAAAWVQSGTGPAIVDGTGRVLDRVAAAPVDLPQVADVTRVPPVGATISPALGARVAGRLLGDARSGTRTIAVTDHGVNLSLASGVEIRLGPPTAVMTKVRAADAVLGALNGEAVSYVDVAVPSNPVAG